MANRKKVETAKNRFPGRTYTVDIALPEFAFLCPVTGNPGFGTIRISYVPGEGEAEPLPPYRALAPLNAAFVAERRIKQRKG